MFKPLGTPKRAPQGAFVAHLLVDDNSYGELSLSSLRGEGISVSAAEKAAMEQFPGGDSLPYEFRYSYEAEGVCWEWIAPSRRLPERFKPFWVRA